jgi:hypothetical protein
MPALTAAMRGLTTAPGETRRSRMPMSSPKPTRAPLDQAAIHSRTGISQTNRTKTTMMSRNIRARPANSMGLPS